MDLQNYAFIDGNYLARAYEAAMKVLFPDASSRHLDLAKMKQALGASKVFYYDAVDEDAPNAAERKVYLDTVASLDGFHVRLGSVSKRKKKREQKQVDVSLAVECLTHAFRKNFWHVTLVAGDLDFKPLVTALVNLGAHVHVFYEATSGNKDLYRAADVARCITIEMFHSWSTSAHLVANPLPNVVGAATHSGEFMRRQGLWNTRTAKHYFDKSHGAHILAVSATAADSAFYVKFDDLARLEAYFTYRYGPIAWDPNVVPEE